MPRSVIRQGPNPLAARCASASLVTPFGAWSGETKTITNSFYLNTLGTVEEDATSVTAEQIASGEIAYLVGWGQNLGGEGERDAAPVPYGLKVYRNQLGGCNEDSFVYEYSNERKDAVTTHPDVDKNHICDNLCGKEGIGEHSDGDDADHLCDYCAGSVNEDCLDASPKDHICDECGREGMGIHADGEDSDHICDYCNLSAGEDCYDIEPKDHICDECGREGIGAHSDSATDGDHLCDYGCGARLENCTPGADDGDCTTDITCAICGAVTDEGAESHTGGTATCTAKARCENCGKEYGDLLDHTYATEYKNDATNHWQECTCGDKANISSHVDTNNDEKCDACEYAMPRTPSAPDEGEANEGEANEGETNEGEANEGGANEGGANEGETNEGEANEGGANEGNESNGNTDENGGLGAGAIIGIAAGSAAAVGIGGFSLFWFVIKKKKLSDLFGAFRK